MPAYNSERIFQISKVQNSILCRMGIYFNMLVFAKLKKIPVPLAVPCLHTGWAANPHPAGHSPGTAYSSPHRPGARPHGIP